MLRFDTMSQCHTYSQMKTMNAVACFRKVCILFGKKHYCFAFRNGCHAHSRIQKVHLAFRNGMSRIFSEKHVQLSEMGCPRTFSDSKKYTFSFQKWDVTHILGFKEVYVQLSEMRCHAHSRILERMFSFQKRDVTHILGFNRTVLQYYRKRQSWRPLLNHHGISILKDS